MTSALLAGPAYAACTAPAGVEGQIIYNSAHKVMQFCDNTNWIAMGAPAPVVGVADGDKGDIVVSGAGSVWTVKASLLKGASGTAGRVQLSDGAGGFTHIDGFYWVNTPGYMLLNGSMRFTNAPASGQAVLSVLNTAVTGQGDNYTHFGYNSSGTIQNYLRGDVTYIDTPVTRVSGQLRVNQICDASGGNCRNITNPHNPSGAGVVGSYMRGAYDWSNDPSFPTGYVAWNAAHYGLEFVGDKSWTGAEFLPINPGQKWHMTVTVKNTGTVTTRLYAGVATYNQNFSEIKTDSMHSYNYHVASSQEVAPGATATFSATMYGWNPVGGTGTGFDPYGAYFRPILLMNYLVPTGRLVLQGISVFPVP